MRLLSDAYMAQPQSVFVLSEGFQMCHVHLYMMRGVGASHHLIVDAGLGVGTCPTHANQLATLSKLQAMLFSCFKITTMATLPCQIFIEVPLE